LGPSAYEFIDFLAAAHQGLWQVLPLQPPANSSSPYSSISAFAGNPLLISMERLAERGWIGKERLKSLSDQAGDINYEEVKRTKLPLLEEAGRNFLKKAPLDARQRFTNFCQKNSWWLEDFVLFDALREVYQKRVWSSWPKDLAQRQPQALAKARQELNEQLETQRVIQFAFWEQWRAVRSECAKKSIRVVGDIAIFVDYDSADVWQNTDLFELDENLQPIVVSGVPPDAFSATGQRWGNPLYNWDAMRTRGYEWWIERLRWATQTCDYIRLDHFRGFAQFWEIPATEKTAMNGRWVDGPGDDLFNALQSALGGLPFFAEDLGYITEDVHALRERHHIPGMAVLQFGFGDEGSRQYLPHRMTPNHVIYTGTHDNDTTLGWWESASEEEKDHARCYLGPAEDGINWALIRAAQSSVASLAVAPLQDVLGLGSEARLNKPSTQVGNYRWRFGRGDLKQEHAQKLADLAEVTDRLPVPCPMPQDNEFAA
jgi:4-alpha-glucanotransferase